MTGFSEPDPHWFLPHCILLSMVADELSFLRESL